MSDDWFCKIAGEERGPLSAHDLKTMAAEGQLLPDDLVRHGPQAAWVAAGRVKGLFPASGSSGPRSAAATADPQAGRLPKARPVARPLADPRSSPPSGAAKRGPAGLPPPPTSDENEPAAPGALGEFDFLEEAYSTPPRSAVPGTKSPASELMEKKRRDERRNMTILLAVLVGLMIVLGVLMAVLFVKQRGGGKEKETPQAVAAGEDADAGKPGDEKTAGADRIAEGAKKDAKKDPKDSRSAKGKSEGAWVDASKRGAPVGDITVKVLSAAVTRRKPKAGPERIVLEVSLQLSNAQKAKKREYKSWSAVATGVSLVDDLGNTYRLLGGAEGGSATDSIYHDEPVTDVLLFERPVPDAKRLRLTLPGSAFEEKGSALLEIPASMVAKEDARPDDKAPAQKSAMATRAQASARAPHVEPPARGRAATRPDELADGPTGDPRKDLGIDSESPPPGPATPWSAIPDPPSAKPDSAKAKEGP